MVWCHLCHSQSYVVPSRWITAFVLLKLTTLFEHFLLCGATFDKVSGVHCVDFILYFYPICVRDLNCFFN